MVSDIFDNHLKLSLWRVITAIICADLMLVLFFYQTHNLYQEYTRRAELRPSSLSGEAQEVPRDLPVHLTIPTIGVDARIESVGVTEDGAMVSPSNSKVVAWFNLGPRPGDLGSAVIAGHFNSEKSDQGVFLNLSELRRGDQVFVENDQGKNTTFVVREIHTYAPGYVDDVFNWGMGSHLNLVTCDGVWNPLQKNFSKRLVVFTDLVN